MKKTIVEDKKYAVIQAWNDDFAVTMHINKVAKTYEVHVYIICDKTVELVGVFNKEMLANVNFANLNTVMSMVSENDIVASDAVYHVLARTKHILGLATLCMNDFVNSYKKIDTTTEDVVTKCNNVAVEAPKRRHHRRRNRRSNK